MRVITYYTDDRYEAMARRMVESAERIGLVATAYPKSNPTGEWMKGMNLKPQVVLDAMLETPDESILFIDADCIFVSFPTLLDEKTHDADLACSFDGPTKPTSSVVYFRKNTALKYVQRWVQEMAANPGKLDDYVCLWNAMTKILPRARVLHLPPAYSWVEEWLRPRFGPVKPVIWHHAVGEHRTIDLTWQKTKACIF